MYRLSPQPTLLTLCICFLFLCNHLSIASAVVCNITASDLSDYGEPQNTTSPYTITGILQKNFTIIALTSKASYQSLVIYTIGSDGNKAGDWGIMGSDASKFERPQECGKQVVTVTDTTTTKTAPQYFGWQGALEGNYTIKSVVFLNSTTYWILPDTNFTVTDTMGGAYHIPSSAGEEIFGIMFLKICAIIVGIFIFVSILYCAITSIWKKHELKKALRERPERQQQQATSPVPPPRTNREAVMTNEMRPSSVRSTCVLPRFSSTPSVWTGDHFWTDDKRTTYATATADRN